MSFELKLKKLQDKFQSVTRKLNDPKVAGSDEFVKLSKEFSELSAIVPLIDNYFNTTKSISDAKDIIKENADKDLVELAELELYENQKKLPTIEHELKISLLPKDENDDKNVIVEIRAGTGGDEAALFAAQLFNMYQRYAESKRWKFEILAISDTGIGGFKEASANISGNGVYARMKFESGVHRVQRVPQTESQGRVHTSAATVAVLPEAEEVDVHIDEEKDLRIDVYRASGAGGQHVNTTESAVRITHLPTGVVVAIQDEKSQHKNKAKALKLIRAKVFDIELEKRNKEISASRKSQVGTGDRSERIRTYNFPQGRVTDHRINLTLYKITEIVSNGDLDDIIEKLISEDQADKLSYMEEE